MSSVSSSESSKCPVEHHQHHSKPQQQTDNMASKCPVEQHSSTQPKATAAPEDSTRTCPADHTRALDAFLSSGDTSPPQQALDPQNQMPKIPEQHVSDGQRNTLSTERTMSTIPRAERYQSAGDSACPALHEDKEEKKDVWIYPSEQMFFNAMKRKRWDPQEPDMKYVVPIHNAVNEMCWNQILGWEQMHRTACGEPKLLKFEGKAHALTPRARFFSLVGYQKPFDRHDWTVDRCGKHVRYVIDFYEGKRDARNPHAPSFYLDVRPALTLESAWDRMRRFAGL
ncbi:Cytochrome c1 heme lyase [Coemansia erecta]|nr:Cytochrome c1 heme lyase [Coemansia erecta]